MKGQGGDKIQLNDRIANVKDVKYFIFAERETHSEDEIPLLIIAAAFAEGKSVFRDIAHLRTFEKDLLKQIIATLKSTTYTE